MTVAKRLLKQNSSRTTHAGDMVGSRRAYVVLFLLAFMIAAVLVLPTSGSARGETESGTKVAEKPGAKASAGPAARAKRGPDSILGAPRSGKQQALRYARKQGGTRYILQTIPRYYKLAPQRNIAPDVLVAQAMVETGYGRYGGDAKPWNMAGIKKRNATGDAPRDFERPKTAHQGVRMHVNHMAAYTNKKPLGKPHGRYYVVRDIREENGYIRKISDLSGTWATDPAYARKIRSVLNEMGRA